MAFFDRFRKKDGRFESKAFEDSRFPGEPRDGFKPKEYYIAQLQRVDDFQRELEVATRNEDGGRKRYCTMIDQYLFRRISLLYVLRADRQELASEAACYCRKTHERVQLGDELTYNVVCRALSFATLFELGSLDVGFLKDPLELQGMPEDAVSDILQNTLFCSQANTSKDFYYKDKGYFGDGAKDTGGLMKAISADSSEKRTAEFVTFLNTVKEKHYQRLLKHYEEVGESRYVYTGSYDFRLTALAKALGIDKNAVADSKFIAVDLI